MRKESKGIVDRVMLGDKELTGWSIFSLLMNHPEKLHCKRSSCPGPCFLLTSLVAASPTDDTFLNTTPIQKGFVWINGIPLGRAWNIGPQASLFMPGSWLKKGKNSLVILDFEAHKSFELQTSDHALWIQVLINEDIWEAG